MVKIDAAQKEWEASIYGGADAIEAQKAALAASDSAMLAYASSAHAAADATRDLSSAVSQLSFAQFGPFTDDLTSSIPDIFEIPLQAAPLNCVTEEKANRAVCTGKSIWCQCLY